MPSISAACPPLPFSIGPPVWACDAWAGKVYPQGTPRREYLQWYTRTFNAVEGNSTFYGLPAESTFERWAEESAEGFEFCLKFPKAISHDAMLEQCRIDLEMFLDRLAILDRGGCLGPTFLQLGQRFGPDRFDVLRRFLEGLPDIYPWAVEVRHPGWFDAGDDPVGQSNEQRLDELLRRLKIDKVLFDSTALFASDPDDEIETLSQSKKPRTPWRDTATSHRPMIRMVGRNRVEKAVGFIERWRPIVADWVDRGLRPIIFTHAPDDAMAPDFARLWLDVMRPALPRHRLHSPTPPQGTIQPTLFD